MATVYDGKLQEVLPSGETVLMHPETCLDQVIYAHGNTISAKQKIDEIDARIADVESSLMFGSAVEYGVRRPLNAASPKFERVIINHVNGIATTIINPPNLIANVGVGDTSVYNSFDNIKPWSEMRQVNIQGNIMVNIPTDWWINEYEVNDYHYLFITTSAAVAKAKGYRKPVKFYQNGDPNAGEVNNFYIGAYTTSGNGLKSVPGDFPTVEKTRAWFRNQAKTLGEGWHTLDIATWMDVIRPLFLVEFATLNSQTIMYGHSNWRFTGVVDEASAGTKLYLNCNNIPLATLNNTNLARTYFRNTRTGGTQVSTNAWPTLIATTVDGEEVVTQIEFPVANINIYTVGDTVQFDSAIRQGLEQIKATSGSVGSLTNGQHVAIYRGIESPWGGLWQFLDGVNIEDQQAYVSADPSKYADDVWTEDEGYHKLSYVNSTTEGYVKTFGTDLKYPWAKFPTAVGGSSSTYYSDWYWTLPGKRLVIAGARWGSGAGAGLFCLNCGNAFSASGLAVGSRLLFTS